MSVLYIRDAQGKFVPVPALQGKSAYQYAQDGGYTGTEAEFAAKLAAEVYSKAETDAAISEATRENVEWEVIKTIKLEENTRAFTFNELHHRRLRLEFIIQNEGGEIVMPAGILAINGKQGIRINAQKMSAGSPMYRRVELWIEDGLIFGNTSYSRNNSTSYGTESPLGNSYNLDVMNDWKIINTVAYAVNSAENFPSETEIVLKGVRA